MTRKATKKTSPKSRKPTSDKSRRREDQENVAPTDPINPPAVGGGGKSKGDGPAQA